MNDVQVELEKLAVKRWTMAAVATELGINQVTVRRWRSGLTYPDVPGPILLALKGLAKRKRVPKHWQPMVSSSPGTPHTVCARVRLAQCSSYVHRA